MLTELELWLARKKLWQGENEKKKMTWVSDWSAAAQESVRPGGSGKKNHSLAKHFNAGQAKLNKINGTKIYKIYPAYHVVRT